MRRNADSGAPGIGQLRTLYDEHHCSAEHVLGRIRRDNTHRRQLSERDLAVDPRTETTDQNHIGGVERVTELARVGGISSGHRVCDLGCGIGGPARWLAAE